MDNSFGKTYKLCSKILIDSIFNSGETVKEYPFVAKYNIVNLNENIPFQIAVTAPKKRFRKAVQRNRIKRLCRESIRTTKTSLEDKLIASEKQLAIFLIYSGDEELTFQQMQHKMSKLFNKLITKLENHDA